MSKLKVNQLETLDGSKIVNVADLSTATASAVSNTPAGGISATNVQAAINELDAEKFSKSGGDIDGNVSFTGSGRRITGDFSDSTDSNRVLFQTKTLNAGTALSAIPNGTGLFSQFSAYSKSDPDNSSVVNLSATATDVRLVATLTGTGAYLPLTFHAGGAERLRIDTSGNVGIGTSTPKAPLHSFNASNYGNPDTTGTGVTGVSARIQGGTVNMDFGVYSSGNTWIQSRLNTDNATTFQLVLNPVGGTVLVGPGGFGYAAGIGSGGMVTQATSKSTTVTLNKQNGLITLNNAALAPGATVGFTMNNSTISAGDLVAVCLYSSSATVDAYRVFVDRVDTGLARIIIQNYSSGSLSEGFSIKFSVIKGSIS